MVTCPKCHIRFEIRSDYDAHVCSPGQHSDLMSGILSQAFQSAETDRDGELVIKMRKLREIIAQYD